MVLNSIETPGSFQDFADANPGLSHAELLALHSNAIQEYQQALADHHGISVEELHRGFGRVVVDPPAA